MLKKKTNVFVLCSNLRTFCYTYVLKECQNQNNEHKKKNIRKWSVLKFIQLYIHISTSSAWFRTIREAEDFSGPFGRGKNQPFTAASDVNFLLLKEINELKEPLYPHQQKQGGKH